MANSTTVMAAATSTDTNASTQQENSTGNEAPSGFILKLFQMVSGAPDEVIAVSVLVDVVVACHSFVESGAVLSFMALHSSCLRMCEDVCAIGGLRGSLRDQEDKICPWICICSLATADSSATLKWDRWRDPVRPFKVSIAARGLLVRRGPKGLSLWALFGE